MQSQFESVAKHSIKGPTYQESFGRRIKELRESVSWTQVDLAVHSSVSESQISLIENGHESPRLNTIKALANALGKTPSQLLDYPFDQRLNTNFSTRRKTNRRLGTTKLIRKLFDENYFKQPRTVKEVISYCVRKYQANLASADTSGALLQLVVDGKLKKKLGAGKINSYENKQLT